MKYWDNEYWSIVSVLGGLVVGFLGSIYLYDGIAWFIYSNFWLSVIGVGVLSFGYIRYCHLGLNVLDETHVAPREEYLMAFGFTGFFFVFSLFASMYGYRLEHGVVGANVKFASILGHLIQPIYYPGLLLFCVVVSACIIHQLPLWSRGGQAAIARGFANTVNKIVSMVTRHPAQWIVISETSSRRSDLGSEAKLADIMEAQRASDADLAERFKRMTPWRRWAMIRQIRARTDKAEALRDLLREQSYAYQREIELAAAMHQQVRDKKAAEDRTL